MLDYESCVIYGLGKSLTAKHVEGSTANDASKGLHAACLLCHATGTVQRSLKMCLLWSEK